MSKFFYFPCSHGNNSLFFWNCCQCISQLYVNIYIYNASLISCMKYLSFPTLINSVCLLVGTQKHLLILLNYCKLEKVPLTLLIYFQFPAGTSGSKIRSWMFISIWLATWQIISPFWFDHFTSMEKVCREPRHTLPMWNVPCLPWIAGI